MKYLTLLYLAACSIQIAAADTTGKTNLTNVIKQLEKDYHITISHSPSFTNGIMLLNTPVPKGANAGEALRYITRGLPVEIKTIGSTYCIIRKTEAKSIPKHSPERETKRDTVRLSALTAPELHLQAKQKTQIPGSETLCKQLYIQKSHDAKHPDRWGVRTNSLALLTGTFNAGADYLLNDQYAIGGDIAFNPGICKKIKPKHISFRTEVRRWLNTPRKGHFISSNIQYTHYQSFNKKLTNNSSAQYIIGPGISYGYNWLLSGQLRMEFDIGLGLFYNSYIRSNAQTETQHRDNRIIIIPNKLALNIIYTIR